MTAVGAILTIGMVAVIVYAVAQGALRNARQDGYDRALLDWQQRQRDRDAAEAREWLDSHEYECDDDDE